MSSYYAYFVRTQPEALLESGLLSADEQLEDTCSGFCTVSRKAGDFDLSFSRLQLLSQQLGVEVIALVYQSAAGSFAFGHWLAGELQRELAYG